MSRGRLPTIQMNTGNRAGVYCSAFLRQPEPAQHLPIDPEVARVFRAQQLPDPRTGSYDHARGRVHVSVGPQLDRAMRFLMEVENDLRGEDLRAQLSRQIELR